jgi:hypothetical protein
VICYIEVLFKAGLTVFVCMTTEDQHTQLFVSMTTDMEDQQVLTMSTTLNKLQTNYHTFGHVFVQFMIV